MIAFVIKNKEGEYLQYFDTNSDDIKFTTDLTSAMLYDENEINIMKKAYQEFNFIEITIAEDDLEQENEQLKEQLEKKADLIGELDGYFEDIFTELDGNWREDERWQGGMKAMYKEAIREIKELKQQLTDKDKEIERLKEALELAIDDGNEKIFDTYCIDKAYYYGSVPSMRSEDDYIKQVEGYIKETKEEE